MRLPEDVEGGGGRGGDPGLAALPADRRAAFDKRMADIDQKWPQGVRATVKDFVNHIDYIVKLIGIDHVRASRRTSNGGGGVTRLERRRRNGQRDSLELVRRNLHRGANRQELERQSAPGLGRVERSAKGIQAGTIK
jgi:membrane dipeptidase